MGVKLSHKTDIRTRNCSSYTTWCMASNTNRRCTATDNVSFHRYTYINYCSISLLLYQLAFLMPLWTKRLLEQASQLSCHTSPLTSKHWRTASVNKERKILHWQALPYLTLPYYTIRGRHLLPCTEASSGRNAHSRINLRVTETFCRFLQTW